MRFPSLECVESPAQFLAALQVPTHQLVAEAAGDAVRPSGEKATLVTEVSCPDNVCNSSPSGSFQSLMSLSPPPERALRPSGEKATLLTPRMCPGSESFSLPVSRSQSRAVSSSLPERPTARRARSRRTARPACARRRSSSRRRAPGPTTSRCCRRWRRGPTARRARSRHPGRAGRARRAPTSARRGPGPRRAHDIVLAAGNRPSAVGREGDALDVRRMAGERHQLGR